jgi:hypothetical protein
LFGELQASRATQLAHHIANVAQQQSRNGVGFAYVLCGRTFRASRGHVQLNAETS